MQGKIVRHLTKDGIYLNGLFNEKKSEKAIFFSHGWAGDFYQDMFIDNIAEIADKLGYGFLTAQNRGTSDTYNFKTQDGNSKTIGAVHEKFEDCIYDFEAWLYFLYLKGYKEVILVGHSFSCHKIAYFMKVKQHPMIMKTVLITPFDIFDLFSVLLHQDKDSVDANLKLAKKLIDQSKGNLMMSEDSLWFPISAFAYYDHFGPESKLHIFDFNYDSRFQPDVLKKMTVPTLTIVGSSDLYVRNHTSFLESINKAISNSSINLIEGAAHSYQGYEKKLQEVITQFVKL